MNEEQYLDLETLMLPISDGEVECAILDYFAFEGKKYAIVSPVVEDAVSDTVEIFRYKENGDAITFDLVSDKNSSTASPKPTTTNPSSSDTESAKASFRKYFCSWMHFSVLRQGTKACELYS